MAFNLRKIRNITSKELTTVGIKTSNYTANSFERILVDTTAAPLTVFLPPEPVEGDRVDTVDVGGSAETNVITFDGNGAMINGVLATTTMDVDYGNTNFIYTKDSGWVDYGKWVSDLIPRLSNLENSVSPAEVLYMHSNFGGF